MIIYTHKLCYRARKAQVTLDSVDKSHTIGTTLILITHDMIKPPGNQLAAIQLRVQYAWDRLAPSRLHIRQY